MEHEIEIEVRYYETDGQGVVHHANYFKYFELARVLMLREMGREYADLEREGIFLVVHSVGCKFLRPARFGDHIRLITKVTRTTAARIDHEYHGYVGDQQVVEGNSTIACVDREGNICRIPEYLMQE